MYDYSDINFKTSMIRSHLWDYSDACIHVKITITVPNTAAQRATVNSANKKVMFKNCAQFTKSKINNTQVDDAQDIDRVIPMYNLIKHSDAYSKISGNLWQYYRDEPALGNNHNTIDFPEITTILFCSNLRSK